MDGDIDHEARAAAWEEAFARDSLPPHVAERLEAAEAGRQPWIATMTPAELLLARSHGIRPLAMVSGTCWFHYGWSWTEGHAEGWHRALDRIRREAKACGANAVVDVKLRTLRHSFGPSMDFTLFGTAIRLDRLPPGRDPVIATVPALEFVRLLEMGIVPTGLAVGARYDWLGNPNGDSGYGWGGDWTALSDIQMKLRSWTSQPILTLTEFWESIRRAAHADLRRNAAPQGNGVLAHTHFGQLLRRERDKQPPAYLGRHIVVGTVVDTPKGAAVPHGITPVIDMRDTLSPLRGAADTRHQVYEGDMQEQEGPI